MAKAISDHSTPKCAMAMAIVAIPVAPPLAAKARPAVVKKTRMALNGVSITKLRNVTCDMGSHSVSCCPTQVNAPRSNPARRRVLDLPTPEG